MKGKKTYSIIHLKCPRCQEGDLFVARNAYNLKRMLEMPGTCPVCKQNFEMEPGFYSGALWVSFPIIVLIAIPFYLVMDFILGLSFEWMAFIMAVYILGLQPLVMRYSRAIWINVFVSYDPGAKGANR
jgi:uncharacterized protein (DUF983 family)